MSEQYNQHVDDEIDLFDLIDDVTSQWRWVVVVMFLSVAMGLAYALLATPKFKAKTELVATSQQNLIAINLAKEQLSKASDLGDYKKSRDAFLQKGIVENKSFLPLEPGDVFAGFITLLSSERQKQRFYDELRGEEPDVFSLFNKPEMSKEENLEVFLERFTQKIEKTKNSEQLKFVMQFSSQYSELSAKLLNDYVAMSMSEFLMNYRKAFDYELTNAKSVMKNLKRQALSSYEFSKTKRIAMLKEAIAIAARIGQKKPFYNLNQVVTANEPPLYMMGELALREELRQLESRKKEVVYIEGFPILNEKSSLLDNIDMDWDSAQLVRVDAYAQTPRKPFKPKKALIVAISGIVGLMLGVMLALFVSASKRRTRLKEQINKGEA